MEKTLALVGAIPDASTLGEIRKLSGEGAHTVAWQHSRIVQDRFPSPDIAEALRRAQIPHEILASALGENGDAIVDDAVIGWMKAFGRDHFRGQFRRHGLELWWWAELYLYHETPLRLIVRDVEALARLVERTSPGRIVLFSPPRRLEAAARSLCERVEMRSRSRAPGPPFWWTTTRLHASDYVKMMGSGLKSLLRRRPKRAPGKPRVFFLTHASMWREGREIYFDRILPEVTKRAGGAIVVAFGPPTPFQKRTLSSFFRDLLELDVKDKPFRAVREYLTFTMTLRLSGDFGRCWLWFQRFRPGEALSHRGVSLGPQAMACFRDTFLRQFPWAFRSHAEVDSVLEWERPDVLTLYAESSGLGRAAIAAADARGIRSVAIQHGIMYPRYYSHEHAPDEIRSPGLGAGVPIPTETAVFGNLAKELLIERGSYPVERILVTGSPKFDALVETARAYDRGTVRTRLGVPEGFHLLVLATRWSAVEGEFAGLVDAVEASSDVVLYVKPHQAETPAPYERVLEHRKAQRTRIVSGAANLLELIVGSDGLVTVDSLASSEALVLGRPVLLLGLPSNLSALAERGAALGVRRGESIAKALRKFLSDEPTRRALREKRDAYIQDFAFGADGRSTERIVSALLGAVETDARVATGEDQV